MLAALGNLGNWPVGEKAGVGFEFLNLGTQNGVRVLAECILCEHEVDEEQETARDRHSDRYLHCMGTASSHLSRIIFSKV